MSKRLHKLEPKSEGFSGYVTFEIPTHAERIEMLKELGFSLSGANIVPPESDLGLLVKMLNKAISFVKEVKLVYAEQELNTVEDLELYEECMPVIMEIVDMLKTGFRLGKK